jgi:hypothetical protein
MCCYFLNKLNFEQSKVKASDPSTIDCCHSLIDNEFGFDQQLDRILSGSFFIVNTNTVKLNQFSLLVAFVIVLAVLVLFF